MIDKKFIRQLKKDYDVSESERRQIISLANIVLHSSKRAIFSLHRGQIQTAKDLLAEIEKILMQMHKKFGYYRLTQEGAYKAGAEEYVEAKMFYRLTAGQKVEEIKEIQLNQESLVAGICDLTGELVRLAINQAAAGKLNEAGKIKKMIDEIMGELVQFDMTGYLRTKYDQAKMNLRKIEQINYEIKIRTIK